MKRGNIILIILICILLIILALALRIFVVTGRSIISLQDLTSLVINNQRSNAIIVDGVDYIKDYDAD